MFSIFPQRLHISFLWIGECERTTFCGYKVLDLFIHKVQFHVNVYHVHFTPKTKHFAVTSLCLRSSLFQGLQHVGNAC